MDIRLHFDNFWAGFDKNDNVWVWILKQKHNVILDSITPNLVITMSLKRPINGVYTIYYSNEPFVPSINTNNADHFLSNFFIDSPNHTRFPSYYMYIHEFIKCGLINDLDFFDSTDRIIPVKTNFCSFVSRSLNGKRGEFFNKLNEYKHVETNVTPYRDFSIPFDSSTFSSTKPKIEFIKKYKFNIAFENNFRGTHPCFPNAVLNNGYLVDMGGLISEKLIEPFISGTLPIYWGSKMVGDEFNSNTFINYYDFDNEDDLINKIIELDKNDDLYNSYFKNKIKSDVNGSVLNLDYLINMFDSIVKNISS